MRMVKRMGDGCITLCSIPLSKREREVLREIMGKLVSISDVDAAGLLKMDGSVISWHMNEVIELSQYIDFMLDYISHPHEKNFPKNGMFMQKILDFNGYKILLSWIGADVILMLLLDKNAYLGLAMLDVEGSLREIEKVLGEDWS